MIFKKTVGHLLICFITHDDNLIFNHASVESDLLRTVPGQLSSLRYDMMLVTGHDPGDFTQYNFLVFTIAHLSGDGNNA